MLFAEYLTPELDKIIAEHEQKIWDQMIIPQDCGHASYLWGATFRQHAPEANIKYISGSYIGDLEPDTQKDIRAGSSPPGRSEHCWLEIDGYIFDPTAGQFAPPSGQFKRQDYLEDRRRDIDQVISEEAELVAAEQEELRSIDLQQLGEAELKRVSQSLTGN